MNEKLISFLSQKENLRAMLDYITVEAPDAEDDVREKFPYKACEVICCDVTAIVVNILDDNALLARMFQARAPRRCGPPACPHACPSARASLSRAPPALPAPVALSLAPPARERSCSTRPRARR